MNESENNRDRPVEPGLYILDQTFRKFVVRPDVDQMLKDLNLKRTEAKEAIRVKQEEDAAAELVRPATPKAVPKKKPAVKPAAKPAAKPSAPKAKPKAK